jgi:hypothetical protein
LKSLLEIGVYGNQLTGRVPPAPSSLTPGRTFLCPNPLDLTATANDAAWNTATGNTPWWGPAGEGCDSIFKDGYEYGDVYQ